MGNCRVSGDRRESNNDRGTNRIRYERDIDWYIGWMYFAQDSESDDDAKTEKRTVEVTNHRHRTGEYHFGRTIIIHGKTHERKEDRRNEK